METEQPVEVVNAEGVLDSSGHIKPELMAILSFGAESSEVWEEKGEAVRLHLETCRTCRAELEENGEENFIN